MSAAESPLRGLDLEPLSAAPAADERASSRARLKAEAPEFVPPWPLRTIAVILVVGVGALANGVLAPVSASGMIPGLSLRGLSFLVGAAILVGGGVWLVLSRRAAWGRRLRLAVFAERNGFEFRPTDDSVYPGVVFQQGGGRRLENVLRRSGERVVEVGEFVFETGNEKNRRVHRRGYLLLQLDRRLPHILLDARANNGLFGSNLPIGFNRSQILSLEGDFDRHFTLYCPSGYERDALYVFTPEVMAAFIDSASHVDVEIVDDLLFVYVGDGLRLDDPHEWSRIGALVTALWPKTAKQTAAYSDDRVSATVCGGGYPSAQGTGGGLGATPVLRERPTEVADAGRRLRARVPVLTMVLSIALTGAAVAFWVVRLAS